MHNMCNMHVSMDPGGDQHPQEFLFLRVISYRETLQTIGYSYI